MVIFFFSFHLILAFITTVSYASRSNLAWGYSVLPRRRTVVRTWFKYVLRKTSHSWLQNYFMFNAESTRPKIILLLGNQQLFVSLNQRILNSSFYKTKLLFPNHIPAECFESSGQEQERIKKIYIEDWTEFSLKWKGRECLNTLSNVPLMQQGYKVMLL